MDVYAIDKARVRSSFDRAASSYDAAAVLQKLVREEMFSRLELVKIKPERILDAGCGTGHGSTLLQKRFGRSQLISLDLALGMLQQTASNQSLINKWLHPQQLVCADIEHLPIGDNRLGLVWSNLALQWCNDLDQSFSEMMRVLQPEGLLVFSTFGPDTLKELRIASRGSNEEHTRVSRFIDMHDIGDALSRAGFSGPVLDVERYTLTYDNVKNVMLDIKAIGAHNATHGRDRGLKGKGFLSQLTQQYEQFRVNGKLPATFEVIYGHAWKSVSRNSSPQDGVPIRFTKRK